MSTAAVVGEDHGHAGVLARAGRVDLVVSLVEVGDAVDVWGSGERGAGGEAEEGECGDQLWCIGDTPYF